MSTGCAVERLEIDRLVEPRREPEQVREPGELAVRDGDALADAGRAEALALQQRVEDGALVEAGEARRMRGELVQRLLLAGNAHRRNDRLGRQEFEQGHRRITRRRVAAPYRCGSTQSSGQGGPAQDRPSGGSIQPIAPSWRR